MAGYIGVPVESDPDVLTDAALQALAAVRPGFLAKEGHLEVWLLEVISRMTAETRYLFGLVPDSIFRYFGASLVNVLPKEGARSTALTTWTMIDNAGYTIRAGTQVAYRVSGDRLVVFETTEDRVVAPLSTVATGVPIRALEIGSYSAGLGPAGLELVDSLSYVLSITAAAVTTGGVDPETDDAYLSRLRDEMQLLTPRFVLAADAVVLARRISGVYRALGIDNYNPADSTFGNEKMITVAVVGKDGLALSSGVKLEVKAYLESMRELNFVVNVIDPTYTTISVAFTVVANAGFDLTDLATRARSVVTQYLSPAVWAGGSETPPAWRKSANVVRYLEVAEVLNRVDGVDYISTLTVNGGTANITLTGVAPLTLAGTVTGTATSV